MMVKMTISSEREPETHLALLDQDEPGPDILAVIGEIPRRWGRMDRLSRLAVLEVGRVLREQGLLPGEPGGVKVKGTGGLIGAIPHGSIATDLAFAATLAGGVNTASPTLFSYTLPNIALAEAASHYGLTGPVYSLFSDDPAEAEAEAHRWLSEPSAPDFMVAGLIDIYPVEAAARLARGGGDSCSPRGEIVSVKFRVIVPAGDGGNG